MASIPGTIVVSRIVPTDTADTFATHDEQFGRGGYRTVQDLTELYAITPERRTEGMLVTVIDDDYTTYQLVGGILNTNWTKYSIAAREPVTAFNHKAVSGVLVAGVPTFSIVSVPEILFTAAGEIV